MIKINDERISEAIKKFTVGFQPSQGVTTESILVELTRFKPEFLSNIETNAKTEDELKSDEPSFRGKKIEMPVGKEAIEEILKVLGDPENEKDFSIYECDIAFRF